MPNQMIKNLLLIIFSLLLCACSGFFEKDNTPTPKALISFTPEIKPHRLWAVKAGSGIGDEYLKIGPAIAETAIFVSSNNGNVSSINKTDGKINWLVGAGINITTGIGIGNDIIVVGSRKGDVVALGKTDGRAVWRTTVPSEILSTPAIENNYVIIKSVDGYLRALSAQDGHEIWSIQQVEPSLILRGASNPLIRDHFIIAGFANGNLAKFTLKDGQLIWMQPIAVPEGGFTIQRMIDIDADPIVFEHHIYAATYQGKIASLSWSSGQLLWTHDISSYTGMIADNHTVYISDAKGYLWAFNAKNGQVEWRQTDLEARDNRPSQSR